MKWGFIKKAPKFFFVVGVLVVSTGLFAVWRVKYEAMRAFAKLGSGAVEDVRPKIARVEAAPSRLLLVDNDLYDLDSGVVVFKGWLKEGAPTALFYDAPAKRIIARYEHGYVRYTLDGKEEAALGQNFPAAFSDDLKWALYVKEQDLWRADINWSEFKFENDRRLTTIEQFNSQFAANVAFSTDKILVIRNVSQLLRVNLETGEVKPTRIPLGEIGKRRSPNGRFMVGLERGQFYCYDVESDDSKAIAIGRGAFNDYQWLGNDRCAALAEAKTVVLYDRLKNNLTEVTALPSPCTKIGEPSPDGRFVFCVGAGGHGTLIDLEKKTATPVSGGAGVAWVSADTFAFSREVPDSELRGTWLHTVGEGERRVSLEPYLVNRGGPLLMATPAGVLVFATKHGLSTMKPDGTEVSELIKLQWPPGRALAMADWKVP